MKLTREQMAARVALELEDEACRAESYFQPFLLGLELFFRHDACGPSGFDPLKIRLHSAYCLTNADDDLLAHVREGHLGVLCLKLSLTIGTDGGSVPERIAEYQPGSIVIEVSAEVSGEGFTVVSAQAGESDRALERERGEQLVTGKLLIEFTGLDIFLGLCDFRPLFDGGVDGLLEAQGFKNGDGRINWCETYVLP